MLLNTGDAIYVGGTPADRVYMGATLVWEAAAGGDYPASGSWSGEAGEVIFHEWTVPSAGEYTIAGTAHADDTQTLVLYLFLNDSTGEAEGSVLGGGARFDPGAVDASWTGDLQAGDIIYWSTANVPDGPVTATWSVDRVPLPVVTLTGSGFTPRNQFRQACIDYGTTYQTVEVLPFRLDTSQATSMTYMFEGCSALTQVPDMDASAVTNMNYMFSNCSALTAVPDMDASNVTTMNSMFRTCPSLAYVPDMNTSNVTNMNNMFHNCSSLTDGNVRLIGRHPNVTTSLMIFGSGLTREPFYDENGNPI